MTIQAGLCRTWSEPKLLVFSRTGSNVNKTEHILLTRTDYDSSEVDSALVSILHRRYTGPQLTSTPIMLCYKRKAVSKIYYPTTMSKINKLLEETARTLYHTVHPDTINAERYSKRGYKQ